MIRENESARSSARKWRRFGWLLLAVTFWSAAALWGASLYPLQWRDHEGNVLPFQSVAEIERFLLTADVVKVKRAPTGTTAPKRVLLEKDGIRMFACFRDVHVNQKQTKLASGQVKLNFRDDAVFEIAAYELGKLLGYRNIPPTVERKIRGQRGTLQAWVGKCMTEKDRLDRKLRAPRAWRWAMEIQAMQLFDSLVYNEDRNRGNVLIDPDWNIWMIDHTRAFRNYDVGMNMGRVRTVERGVWERLRSVTDEQIRDCLSPHLSSLQIKALLKRRAALVTHLQKIIDDLGRGKVLYTLWKQRKVTQTTADPVTVHFEAPDSDDG